MVVDPDVNRSLEQNKYINNNWEENGNNRNNQENDSTQGPNNSTCTEVRTNKGKPSAGQIVVPYIQGLGENLKKICSRYGVQTYFKGSATIKQLLVRPKDQDPKEQKSNVIYSFQCGKVDCDEEYIGEHWGKGGKNIWRNHVPYMPITSKQGMAPTQTTSIY